MIRLPGCERHFTNDEPRPSKIDGLDVEEIPDEAPDLTGVLRIVRVVLQGIFGDIVNVERSALDQIYDSGRGVGGALSVDGLDTGYVSVGRRNDDAAGRNTEGSGGG